LWPFMMKGQNPPTPLFLMKGFHQPLTVTDSPSRGEQQQEAPGLGGGASG
jgi:hypothetical protein